jgi:hypothetical protein
MLCMTRIPSPCAPPPIRTSLMAVKFKHNQLFVLQQSEFVNNFLFLQLHFTLWKGRMLCMDLSMIPLFLPRHLRKWKMMEISILFALQQMMECCLQERSMMGPFGDETFCTVQLYCKSTVYYISDICRYMWYFLTLSSHDTVLLTG